MTSSSVMFKIRGQHNQKLFPPAAPKMDFLTCIHLATHEATNSCTYTGSMVTVYLDPAKANPAISRDSITLSTSKRIEPQLRKPRVIKYISKHTQFRGMSLKIQMMYCILAVVIVHVCLTLSVGDWSH